VDRCWRAQGRYGKPIRARRPRASMHVAGAVGILAP
jgi:hypothetical protein